MSGADVLRTRLCIGADHPSLPGHFPGRPVVPGVVLLDRIAALIQQGGAGRLARLEVVKFLAPVLPGQACECVVERDAARVRFELVRDGACVLRGSGTLA